MMAILGRGVPRSLVLALSRLGYRGRRLTKPGDLEVPCVTTLYLNRRTADDGVGPERVQCGMDVEEFVSRAAPSKSAFTNRNRANELVFSSNHVHATSRDLASLDGKATA
jgi:hypothetical protein